MVSRRLRHGDIDLLRTLNEVFAEAFEDPETHLSKLPSDAYLQRLLEREQIILLAALHEERVIGGLVAYVLEKYEQERSEIYIYDLAVAREHRRKGIARDLINELKPIAKAMGAWVIFVQADRSDAAAIKLYESLGTPEEPLHFDIPVS